MRWTLISILHRLGEFCGSVLRPFGKQILEWAENAFIFVLETIDKELKIKLASNVKNSFNFNYLEDDIIAIHNKIKERDKSSMPMVTCIEIKADSINEQTRYMITLETYIKKGKDTNKNKIEFSVSKIENLPEDLLEKLELYGSVQFYFRDDVLGQ